ncbi:MAG: efflux RND transporter permease subunit [Deltaproteobacteria bacterium]|nr:efflux RND transporter permease subunit [Deltaproteobacteria bacterium]
MKFIQFFLSKSLLVNLLSVFIIIAGGYSFFTMKREAFPHVYLDIMRVETIYSGASPKEVEKLVTIPLEDAVKEVDGVKEIKSLSAEGFSLLVITIDEDAKNKEKIKNDIQRAIDRVTDLPEEVEDPNVREVSTSQTPVIEIALSGGLSEFELRKVAKYVENQIDDFPEVASIFKRGYREREIWVETDPLKLQAFHISLSQMIESLRLKNINQPGGTLDDKKSTEYLIRTVGEFTNPQEVENVIIRSNDFGYLARIKDVATVKDNFERETLIERTEGEKSIGLVVLKKESGDIISLVQKIKKKMEELKPLLPPGLNIKYANDISYYVQRRLNVLKSNAWVGIALVLGCLLLFLNFGMATITAMGIPIAFMTAALVFDFFDLSINLISMFGLVIVLGMLVDDSIVVAENIYFHIEKGENPSRAAFLGTTQVMKPVLMTVFTTVASFLPLAMMEGIMGKFIWQIPAVVIICLVASLLECFFILPSHCVDLIIPLKKLSRKKAMVKETHWFEKLLSFYLKFLKLALTHRYKFMGGVVVTFIFLVIAALTLKSFVLFPSHGIEIFFLRAEVQVGTPLEVTYEKMKPIENLIRNLPKKELDTFVTQVGIVQEDPNDPFALRGSHVGQIIVYLTPEQKRKRTAAHIIDDLRAQTKEISGFQRIYFDRVNPGPPIGKAVAVQVIGEEISVLSQIASQVESYLHTLKGVFDVKNDFETGKKELQIVVDEEKASQAGLSITEISKTVQYAFEGGIATIIKKLDEEIKVRVLLSEQYRITLESFDKIVVPNSNGRLIPLNKVSKLETTSGIFNIKHLDKDRVVTVNANVDNKKTSSSYANSLVQEKFKNISHEFPGYKITYGGEQEDTDKSLNSLKKAFLFAFCVIFIILATGFNSLLQPLIILMAIPFGFIGVILAFFLHGFSFSFMALLGIVGMIGVVVNDAIILVEFINQKFEETGNMMEALLEGGKRRFRPVILTTITTVFGLAPVVYGIGGNDPFLKPAALSITWGLLFSTALTLLVIPCFYLILEDAKKYIQHRTQKRISSPLTGED